VRFGEWVEYFKNQRYHNAIDNVIHSDKYFGRDKEIMEQRKKTEIMKHIRSLYQGMTLVEYFY